MIERSVIFSEEKGKNLFQKELRLAELKKPRKPGTSKLVPQKAISSLKSLANDPRIIEYETMHIEGDLNEEMMDYVMQLPEYHEVLRRMHAIVEELLLFIGQQIPKRVKQVFRRPGAIDVRPVVELFREVHKVISPLTIKRGGFNFIDNTVGQIEQCAISAITAKIRRETVKREHEPPFRSAEEIKFFYQILAQAYAQATRGKELDDGDTVTRFDDLISVKQKKQFGQLMDDEESKNKTDEQLKSEAEEKFELIKETEPLHDFKVAQTLVRGSKIKIAGVKEGLSPHERSAVVYIGRVILHPELADNHPFPQISVNEEGISVITSSVNSNRFFDFIIKPYTSDIFFKHFLPLKQILGGRPYLLLKNAIFDAILDCLTQTEQQITQGGEPEQTVTETRKSIPPVAPGLLEEYLPETEQNQDFFYKRALRGQKGNRVLQALTNLLGDPRNNGSSHFIFTCRDGKSYPIAIHGEKDVGIGMLLTSLKHFGISPKELYEQL